MSPTDWLVAFALWAVVMWRVEACYRRIDPAAECTEQIEVVHDDETWEPADCDCDDESGEDWKLN